MYFLTFAFYQVRLTRSLRVDPTTNQAQDSCRLKRDPMKEATFDDVQQEDTNLSEIAKFYSTPTRVSSNFPQTFPKTSTPELGDENHVEVSEVVPDVELDTSNIMLRSLHLERSGRSKRGAGPSQDFAHQNSLTDNRSVSEDSDTYHTPRSSNSHSRVSSQDHVLTRGTENHVTSREESIAVTSSHDTSLSAILQSNISGASATSFPSLNFTPGLTDPPSSPCHDVKPLLSLPANINPTPAPVRTLKAKKPDIPYNFRYLIDDTEELDNWFGGGQVEFERDMGSPMSVEETFEFTNSLHSQPRQESSISIDFVDPQQLEKAIDVGPLQFQGGNLSRTKHETSLLLKENVELLEVFRIDLEKMVQDEDFRDLEGVTLQVNQIMGLLVDHQLLSRPVIDQNANLILEQIRKSEAKVLEVMDLIKQIEEEDSEDELLQELKDENLKESEDELKEKKADLLIMQIANVIDHEIAIANASNPETSV